MEYFDVLDENGNKKGEIKLREKVHSDGDWHRGTIIFVVNSKGEIVLQKRSANKDSNPNMWTVSASGHLSAGDNSYQAAKRELEEELGIKDNNKQLEYLFTVKEQQRPKKGFIDNEFLDVYLLNIDIDIENVTIQKEEVSEVKFVSYKELQEMVKNKDKTLVEHDEIHDKLFPILEERFNEE